MLNVTKTFLPDFDKYVSYLRSIWDSAWVTNHGPLVTELESRLREYLGVKHFFFVNNGTIAIQIALKAIGAKGEVITTPFSYVASTSSIVWEGCRPVFADIDPETLCIDPAQVERQVSPATAAILGVHVYGTPCDTERLEEIGRRHDIPLIYDAAHAFGVKHAGRSVLSWGDISTLSFHATKVFHTVEGGAIVTNDDQLAKRISYMRNFGHDGPTAFQGLGINGKASEINAAMGLCILPEIERLIQLRREACERYDQLLAGCFSAGRAALLKPKLISGSDYNYAYYPVLFPDEATLLQAFNSMQAQQITPRRYFYPALNCLPYLEQTQPAPVAEGTAARVLCLPLFPGIDPADQLRVVRCIEDSLTACDVLPRVANA